MRFILCWDLHFVMMDSPESRLDGNNDEKLEAGSFKCTIGAVVNASP